MVLNIPVQHPQILTAGVRPTTSQILQGQLAINIPDKKLYTLDNTGAIQQIGVSLSQLATVATSGNYSDLIGAPTPGGSYTLPAATAAVLGGITVPSASGLSITVAGALSNTGVLSVNSRVGAVTLTATDVGLPTDLLSGPSTTVASKYLPSAITGGLSYQGNWNASANTPSLASGGKASGTALANGCYYVVGVAGSTAIDGISTWNVGDLALVSNGLWTRIANSGTTVSSVNGNTGAITLNASNLPGLAAVATTGQYSSLIGAPAPYSLPVATTGVIGGVILNNTAGTAGNLSTGTLAAVALSGNYNDLLNQPVSPAVARLPVNLQGNPNVINEVFYLFTDECQFPQNFASSLAFAELISGTTATVRIMQYPVATPTVGTQVGTLTINTGGSNTFTSTGSSTTYNPGDKLSYQFATTNIALITITLRGTWIA